MNSTQYSQYQQQTQQTQQLCQQGNGDSVNLGEYFLEVSFHFYNFLYTVF